MRFSSLGSGSRGNATLVSKGDTHLLIDCGFSAKEAEKRLQQRGLSSADLTAILVTHEHSDHIAGVRVLAKKNQTPIWATVGTASNLADDVRHLISSLNYHYRITFGSGVNEVSVLPFPVPHDAREPCQFVFESGEHKLGLLTDTGMITPAIEAALSECDALLLETNHDVPMLDRGVYPAYLKQRVSGQQGHLNNEQAAGLLRSIDTSKLKHLVLMHISAQNNTPALALAAITAALPKNRLPEKIEIAAQTTGFAWREMSE